MICEDFADGNLGPSCGQIVRVISSSGWDGRTALLWAEYLIHSCDWSGLGEHLSDHRVLITRSIDGLPRAKGSVRVCGGNSDDVRV